MFYFFVIYVFVYFGHDPNEEVLNNLIASGEFNCL
jgi:hypothetical protein